MVVIPGWSQRSCARPAARGQGLAIAIRSGLSLEQRASVYSEFFKLFKSVGRLSTRLSLSALLADFDRDIQRWRHTDGNADD
jgi:hypothetical protein